LADQRGHELIYELFVRRAAHLESSEADDFIGWEANFLRGQWCIGSGNAEEIPPAILESDRQPRARVEQGATPSANWGSRVFLVVLKAKDRVVVGLSWRSDSDQGEVEPPILIRLNYPAERENVIR
jgi:hypothetical protein